MHSYAYGSRRASGVVYGLSNCVVTVGISEAGFDGVLSRFHW